MGAFRAEQWVPVELAQVFAFFSNPHNLPRIMPPELAARVERIEFPTTAGKAIPIREDARSTEGHPAGATPGFRPAEEGTRIVVSFRPIPFVPLRTEWQARIVSYTPQKEFQDVLERGPFADWHHAHGFREELRRGQRGTIITDHVRFRVGYGWVGRMLETTIERAIGRAFRHRQEQVERLLLESLGQKR